MVNIKMKKTVGILLLGLLFLFGCSDKKFDSNKWKTHKEEQFYMLNDLVNNKRLLGKTKIEIIELLDTTNIKQYNYLDSSWMFIIIVPNSLAIGKAVEVMDINFENNKVKNVTIRH